jgi:hypothetical protein
MVNGERLMSQGRVGLPFTVYCLPKALGVIPQGEMVNAQ